jgi:hypothetical protein
MEKSVDSIPTKSKFISSLIQLLIAVAGVYLTVFGIRLFNQYLLMSFSLPMRIVLTIVTQWTLLIVGDSHAREQGEARGPRVP